MGISKYFNENNLHHAYLIEGKREEILPEIFTCLENFGIKTFGNPDFYHFSADILKTEEALDLRSMGMEKSFLSGKKIFIVSVNRFSFDAQGILLKMFEEPIADTHFFLILPDVNILKKTLLSRCFLIAENRNLSEFELKEAEKFISMPLRSRIDFVKEFIKSADSSEEDEIIEQNSSRSKVLRFLNALEFALHQKLISKKLSEIKCFEQIFKAREYLNQQGSPVKTLLESVAIVVPNL